jgi:hypothetical protein
MPVTKFSSRSFAELVGPVDRDDGLEIYHFSSQYSEMVMLARDV